MIGSLFACTTFGGPLSPESYVSAVTEIIENVLSPDDVGMRSRETLNHGLGKLPSSRPTSADNIALGGAPTTNKVEPRSDANVGVEASTGLPQQLSM